MRRWLWVCDAYVGHGHSASGCGSDRLWRGRVQACAGPAPPHHICLTSGRSMYTTGGTYDLLRHRW